MIKHELLLSILKLECILTGPKRFGLIKFVAWSNGGSAESFAVMTYPFLACPLQKLGLLILMCKLLPKGIKIPY